jgi:hypothetical protein
MLFHEYLNGVLMGFNNEKYSCIPVHEIGKSEAEMELSRYRTFWMSVVNQLVVDVTTNSKNKKIFKVKRLAKAYVRLSNPSFIMICELANLDPVKVVENFRSLV